MSREARVHYLRANARESSPHRLLVLDTESYWEQEGPRELHTLRLWEARLVNRHGHGAEGPVSLDYSGTTAPELADLVTTAAAAKDTTWVYCHNLSFDLGLTRLPLLLVERGFVLGQHNLASEAPWAHLKKGSRRLRLADSFSWLPLPLEKLGQLMDLGKPALPALDDSEAAWRRRCRADVNITTAALCRLMDEWDRRQLGYWSLTGPGTGWNSLRHMIGERRNGSPGGLVHRRATSTAPTRHAGVVIDPDPAAREFERLALYSGRRDLWRVGKLAKGPYVELDLKTAHLAICANYPLPLRRQAAFESLELDDWRLANSFESVIAEVVVQTEIPRYPLRVGSAVLHPVGSFQTVLCGPELLDAKARGDLLSIGRGYAYHVGPYMRPWARWALGILGDTSGEVDPLLQVMVKNWSRTVPGRWGMMHSREVSTGPSHIAGWGLEPCAVGTPPRKGFILHFAGGWSEQVRDTEAEDSFPAVLAHIQSWTRLLLNRALESVWDGDLVSCNTEGFWLHERALSELTAWALGPEYAGLSQLETYRLAELELGKVTAPLEIRIKRTAASLRLRSPQHLEPDGETRYAGVPGSAVPVGADAFEFWTWPKLKGQIERGDPRGYVREHRRVDLSGLPVNRWAYLDGCCEPVRATLEAAGGVTRLCPPCPTCSRHGARLAPLQHPALRGLM